MVVFRWFFPGKIFKACREEAVLLVLVFTRGDGGLRGNAEWVQKENGEELEKVEVFVVR